MKLKKKLISLLTLFSIVFLTHAKVPKNYSQISKLTKKIDQDRVIKNLRSFVRAGHPSRLVGTKGHENAKKFLLNELNLFSGGQVSVHTFSPDIPWAIKEYQKEFKNEIQGKFKPDHHAYKMWDSFTKSMVSFASSKNSEKGRNIIWEKKGSLYPNEVLIIGCNYDSMVHDKNTLVIMPQAEAPGADNNGSGVAVALSLIELLSTIDLPRTVRVIFFDFEQLRFLGSRAYAVEKFNKDQEVAAFLGLVMLGHDSKRTDRIHQFGNMKLYGRVGNIIDKTFADSLMKAGKKSSHSVKFDYVANSFKSAGHVNFWGKGMAVLSFTQDWDNDFNVERNQTSNDFVETLNLKTLYRSYRYIAGSVIAWGYDLKK